jgi:hypothetical protein
LRAMLGLSQAPESIFRRAGLVLRDENASKQNAGVQFRCHRN